MQSLIIEVDLSRLGLGPKPEAIHLLPGLGHLQKLLFDFSTSQLERAPEAPMETLILACRRFYGQREDIPDAPTESPENKDSGGSASSSSQQNQPSAVDSSAISISDISDGFIRVTSPDFQEYTKISVLEPDDDDDDDDEDEEEDDHDNTRSETPDWDSDSDSDEYDYANISTCSSSYSSSTCSDSDSSSNPDTSVVLPPPSIQEEKSFYCSDKHLSICNHLLRLRNNVNSLRMAGFSNEYAHAFISTMFPEAKSLPLEHHSYRVAPSTLWPRLHGQKSWVDAGQGTLTLDDHEIMPDPCVFPEGPIQLPPPMVCQSGIKSFPGCLEPTKRPRNNTTSSGSSWPSQKSLESNEEANTSKSSRSSDEKSRVKKLLDKYKERSRRRPRPTSAP